MMGGEKTRDIKRNADKKRNSNNNNKKKGSDIFILFYFIFFSYRSRSILICQCFGMIDSDIISPFFFILFSFTMYILSRALGGIK